MPEIATDVAEVIDTTLRAAVERGEIAGVVAIATDRDRVIYRGSAGMADLAAGRPMTPDAIFRIASMTKPVVSVAAMQLIEQGRFTLDDPVERHLPEFADLRVFDTFDAETKAYRLRAPARSVTIRQLFTHTSGLGYPFTSPELRDFKPLEGEVHPVDPLIFDPGERWLYGRGLTWLGRLIERLSGQPLESYFQEHIFRPLGMGDTSYFVPDDKLDRLVALNRRHADGTITPEAIQPPTSGFTPVGCGGLTSTGSDYARFTRMLLNGGTLDGRRIVSGETVALMAQDHIGGLGVPAQRSANPDYSNDFSFIADGRDGWGLGFLIAADAVPGGRSAGSLSWGGATNTYFWIDRTCGISGTILMQFLPFADKGALALLDAFERGVYRMVGVATQ
jgi:methyl acetate hydrolase